MRRFHRLRAVALGLVVSGFGAVTAAQADPVTLNFTGTGLSVPTGPPTATQLNFTYNLNYNTPLGLSISGLGAVNLAVINPDGSNPNQGTATFSLPGGSSFTATFAGSIQQASQAGDTTYLLNYTITGGTGIFAGVTGSGTSAGNLNVITGATTDRLTLSLSAPGLAAAIPEPATLLLLGTGLAGVAAGVKRRRKRDLNQNG